jgi:DNA polymerase-3 subunit gamma/tau
LIKPEGKRMPLHLDYRPKNLKELFGNKTTVNSLDAIIKREDDIPHAFLFAGPSGCGKTTLARIVAGALEVSDRDFIEINAANNRGIDTARDILRNMGFKPVSGPVRVYLLDEVHMGTRDFQTALLKALEDTPSHVYFLLCTTEPEKLLATIQNRCSVFAVQRLRSATMVKLISHVLKSERVDDFTEEEIQDIAKSADGCPRQALIILDQVIDLEKKDRAEGVREALIREKQIVELCRTLLKRNSTWSEVSDIIKGINTEQETVRRAVLKYFTTVLLDEPTPMAALVINLFNSPFYDGGKAALTYACYETKSEWVPF